MSRSLSRWPLLSRWLIDLDSAAGWGRQFLRAASGRSWWVAAAGVLVLGGAAAGLHAPTAGAWFWHLANGELIHRDGLGGATTYLARPGASLDLRSWLSDLSLFLIYRTGGLGGLEALGALGGAVGGLFLLLAMRFGGRVHPLAVVVAGGMGMAALAPVLTDFSSEALALLAGALLLALGAVGRHGWWGAGALVALVVVWTNTQADAFLAVLVIWGWLAVAHWGAARSGRDPAPTWWLVPLTGVALLLSPRVMGTLADLPLSLGMWGEHPLLAAWSSIDFHPWSARVAELVGVLLLLSYWMAGARLRRADAYLGLVTATLALLWANYLPWFLVVAAVQSGWYLSVAWLPQETGGELPPAQHPGGSFWSGPRVRAAATVPLLIVLGVLGSEVLAAGRGGGVSGPTASQLPVQAASWLVAHPTAGAWFTTPLFGDYLSARFTAGRHLLCVDDPLPLAGAPLGQCQTLAVLNAGAMATLRSLRARLAVLPRAAPAAAFLLVHGWKIRYRDSTAVILAPRNL